MSTEGKEDKKVTVDSLITPETTAAYSESSTLSPFAHGAANTIIQQLELIYSFQKLKGKKTSALEIHSRYTIK
jgi:hypothetical protein